MRGRVGSEFDAGMGKRAGLCAVPCAAAWGADLIINRESSRRSRQGQIAP